jgi:hypothetical protein
MDKWTRLSGDQRDNLVAYLDGELEDNLTQQIDQVLAKSEVARHEVEALARTWELLDLLPKPAARDDFTERTLTTLKVSEVRPRLVDQPWFGYVRRGSIGVAWVAGLAACAVIGFLITSRGVPGPQDELLTNLPLVKDLDLYLEVPDLHFVNELQKASVFNLAEPEVADDPVRRLDVSTSHAADQTMLKQRHQEIAGMPQSERQRIQYNWATFRALPADKQDSIRTLHEEIYSQPETVHALLDTYRMWLQTLTPGQRDDLRQAKTTGDRLQLVKDFKDKQDASRETKLFDLNLDLRRMKPRMPPPPYLGRDDLVAAMEAMQALSPVPMQQKLLAISSPTDRYIEIFRALFPGGGLRFNDEQWAEIIDVLSDGDMKTMLKDMQGQEQQKWRFIGLLSRGLHAYVVAELEPHYPTVEQLRDFFVSLDGDRRHYLMQRPSEELTRELLKDYFDELEKTKPEIKTPREFLSKLRSFPGLPEMQGGPGRSFRTWRSGPPGGRPPDGDRDPRFDRSRDDGPPRGAESRDNRPGPP